MAAPIRNLFPRRLSVHVLRFQDFSVCREKSMCQKMSNVNVNYICHQAKHRYSNELISKNVLAVNHQRQMSRSLAKQSQIKFSTRASTTYGILKRTSSDDKFLQKTHWCLQDIPFNKSSRTFCTTSKVQSPSQEENDPRHRPGMLRLMDFPSAGWLMLPNAFKFFRNMIMSFLIHNFIDKDFTNKGFIEGAQQAIIIVSSLISQGRFDELTGLVDITAIPEIYSNYANLNAAMRQIIAIKQEDITMHFIYEIGMIFNKEIDSDVDIEVTVVMHCNPAHKHDPQPSIMDLNKTLTICNYRFIRRYSRQKFVPLNDWTINKLNHFKPVQLHQPQA